MNIQEALNIIKQSPNYKILERITLDYIPDNIETPYSLYLDTETTGLDVNNDKVISLSFLKIYQDDNKIIGFGKPVTYYNDPSIPIPKEITQLTNITDDMVRNKAIPVKDIEGIITGAELIIAHNAEFDRQFLEKIMPYLKETTWGCSFKDIPWKEMGFNNAKLEFIASKSDVFYDAHNSESDIIAGAYLINNHNYNNKTGFQMIQEESFKNHYIIKTFNTPFASKDSLKTLGCFWIPEEKTWAITANEENYEQIKNTVLEIYKHYRANPLTCQTYIVRPEHRFSSIEKYGERTQTFPLTPAPEMIV